MENDFTFCPRCATRLEVRIFGHEQRSICPACGFVHFRDPKVAVIALITCDQQVLLSRRGVEPQKGKWAIPGGYMDAGEMPEEALRREMREEMRLELGEVGFHSFLPMANKRGIVLVFAATPASQHCEALAAYDDVSEVRWFGRDSLPQPDQLAFDTTPHLLEIWRREV
ncbi:MAG: NUDIX hydrolase [Caldilineaceae bacterium]